MKQIYLLVLALISSFTAAAQCNYQLVLQDNFGSGFVSPAGVSVSINGTSTFYTVLAAGTAPNVETYPIAIATGDVLIFDYTAPSFTGDMQWSLIDSEGFVLFNSGFNPDSAADFTGTGSCPTCPAVINAAASNIAASTAELAWTRVGTETEWEIEYGPAPYTAGSGGVIVSAVVTNPFTITGLAANTAYDFCVRSVCAPGDLGRNSCGTFTTTPSCPAPGAYNPFNISANEVQFTWDANGNAATNYEIEYALPGVITAPGTNQGTTSLGASAPFGIVGGLTANTTYEFFVRIDCGGGDFSAWTTTPYTARTLQSCPDVSAVTFSNVDQTQVDIAWTNGGTETAWSIEYGAPGFTPGTGTAVAATTNPFTLTGLASGTQYDICVTAVCAANDRSTPVCASILTPADYCNGDLFLDTGGATGDYQNNENITYNICPDNAGDVVYVNFTLNNMETRSNGCYDGLTIYDGPDTTFPTINTPAGGTQWCWNPVTNTGTGNLVGELLIGTSTSGCITIVFSSDGSATRPGWSATVTCAPPPTCPVPSALSAANFTDTTATLSWVAGGTETAWEVEVGLPGFAPNTAATAVPVVSVATNPTTIVSGLIADTSYEYYVRAVCAAGDESIYRGPFAFKTECSPVVAPYTEDFETFTASLLVTEENCWKASSNSTTFTAWDWNLDAAGGTPTANTGPNASFNGVKYFYVEGNGGAAGNIATLVSPLVNVTGLTNPSLQFNYHMFGAATGILRVDINDGTGFVNDVLVITGQQQTSGAAPWELAVIDLSGYASGAIQARFRAERTETGFSGTSDIALDNVVFGEAPACAQPSILVSTSVTDTTALLSWNENGSATSWSVEYGLCGFAPGTGATGAVIVAANTNSGFNITGLSSNTCYEFYVTANCSSGTLSQAGGPARFNTACVAFTVPYAEGFNSTSSTEGCWTVLNVNGDSDTWDLNYASNVGEGNQVAAINTDFNNGNDDDYLISPGIIMTGNDRLRYAYRVQSANEPSNMEVLLSTTGVAPADFTVTLLPAAQYSNITYIDQVIDLSAYTGTIYVAFRIPPSAIDGWRMYIDNVRFETIPGCDEPISLNATNLTATSADIGFTERGTATTWEIEFGAPGFVLGSGTVVNATVNPFSLTGLTSNTCYDYFIRSTCPAGGISPWSVRATFCTACDILVAPYTTGFENFTATTSGFPGAVNGFSREQCWSSTVALYNWVVAPATLTASANTGPAPSINTGNHMFTEASSGATGAITDLRSPLIDLTPLANPIVEFDYHMFGATMGSLQVVVSAAGVETSVLTITGQQHTTELEPYLKATVPLTSYVGQTVQIILRATRGSSFTGDLAIDNFAVIQAPTCIAPSLANINAVTATDASFGWTENGTATVWQVEVQPAGVAQGTAGAIYVNASATNRQAITGLNAATAYSAYVRAACSPTDFSTWVGPINFTTACAVFPAPYSTPFAAIPGHNPTEFAGACWSEGNDSAIAAGPNGANGAWGSDDFGNAVGGPNGLAARINIYDNASIDRDWLVTPEFNLGAAGHSLEASFTVALTVWNGTAASNFGSDDAVELLITADSGVTWTSIRTFNANSGITPAGLAVNVPLTAYSGTVRLAFWSTRGVVADPVDIDFFVDNFAITATAGVYSPDILGFTYYPNPTQGVVNFDAIQPISRIAVRNMLGQVIENIKVDALSMQINLATYATGMYLVEVTTAGRTNIVRIIKD